MEIHCQDERGGQEWEGSGCGYNRATRRILVGMEMFPILTMSMTTSWLSFCVRVSKMLPLEKAVEKVEGISLYYFLQPHVSLQVSQNQKFKGLPWWHSG